MKQKILHSFRLWAVMLVAMLASSGSSAFGKNAVRWDEGKTSPVAVVRAHGNYPVHTKERDKEQS